jgi:hypothetical protein
MRVILCGFFYGDSIVIVKMMRYVNPVIYFYDQDQVQKERTVLP